MQLEFMMLQVKLSCKTKRTGYIQVLALRLLRLYWWWTGGRGLKRRRRTGGAVAGVELSRVDGKENTCRRIGWGPKGDVSLNPRLAPH